MGPQSCRMAVRHRLTPAAQESGSVVEGGCTRDRAGTASGADAQEQGGCAALMRGTEPVTQRRVAGPPSSEAMRGGAARLSCATAGPTE
uniref:Uncharacterized protein n=1 Tax=Oryza rufipogon TaxID=4529 RepID=A0A0E0P7C0_ORYRU